MATSKSRNRTDKKEQQGKEGCCTGMSPGSFRQKL